MKPSRLLPDEIFPAAIRLIYHELMPDAAPAKQRALLRVARFLAKVHRGLGARPPGQMPAPYVGLLPPRDAQDMASWGPALRRRREQCGLSRRQLSELSGVAASTIRNLESGRHRPGRAVVMRLQAVPLLGLPSPTEKGLVPRPRPREVQARFGAVAYSCGCWFAPEYDAIRIARDMVKRFNGIGGPIEPAFLYTDPASALAWRAVTAEADYPQWQLPIDELAEEVAGLIGTAPVDLIGLGAGEAKEEVRLVQALLGRQCGDLRLFLLDLSQPLLSAGYKHAATVLSKVAGVGVFAIQGNFHNLPSYTSLFEATSRRRVLCMFGDTFCTLENEVLFMRNSLYGLAPGDLFIVDIPLAVTPTDRLIELVQRHPLAQLPQDASRLLGRLHDFLIGPFLRYVRGVQRVSLSKQVAPGTSPVPGSYAVDLRAHVKTAHGPERVFSLGGVSKRYDPIGLCTCLRRLGWEQVKRWRYADERHPRLLFLFRKIAPTR